jgi:transcriptional regulator with XRE-family HTH domain
MTTILKSPTEQANRRKAGKMLKALREAQGMTQKNLADAAGIEYYTFISQLEGGYGRVPAEMYEQFAHAFKVDVKRFAQVMVYWYDPPTYKALFGTAPHDLGTVEWVKSSKK